VTIQSRLSADLPSSLVPLVPDRKDAPPSGGPSRHTEWLAAVIRDCRRAFYSVTVFSAVVNLLMLAGPLYMLQIYDRVLTSHSVPTLVALTMLLVGCYGFQGLLDIIRSRIVVRSAALLDSRIAMAVHQAVVQVAVRRLKAGEAQQPVRDLDQIRAFLTSAGPMAIVDLPWVPVFLVICTLIHPWLGAVATAGGLILLAITLLTEQASRTQSRKLVSEGAIRAAMVEADTRNSETVAALGMAATLAQRWAAVNERYVASITHSTDVVGVFGSFSKILRLLLQSAILGTGAYLVIRQELTAGAMIAASIMMGRALAPIETAIANWRGFVGARHAIQRLSVVLKRLPVSIVTTELLRPQRSLDVAITVVAPGEQKPIVSNVQFHLAAGEALGIIGPSGSGKTSLVRVLTGIWPPANGTVRLDGAALDQWDPELRGRYIGYVSQVVELFDGTIAENIARMSWQPDSAAVLAAAQLAGAHDMIVRLPDGYNTRIGEGCVVLSAGQRQRVALARALYGDPFLVVLDEPNSNLDGEGEAALQKAILELKARGAIVIMVAHRQSSLLGCDKALVLMNGTQQAFGPRDAVLARVFGRQLQSAGADRSLRVAAETKAGRDGG
jgi:PrtD family type I secretion system ABC transporter